MTNRRKSRPIELNFLLLNPWLEGKEEKDETKSKIIAPNYEETTASIPFSLCSKIIGIESSLYISLLQMKSRGAVSAKHIMMMEQQSLRYTLANRRKIAKCNFEHLTPIMPNILSWLPPIPTKH